MSTPEELEKLRLETEKLRADIRESKSAPRRAAISTFATILLGIGTIALGVAGFFLNATISGAANHQRDFDNYSKLTEQFSKGGSARVGAVVGFQKLLEPNSAYSTQVATVLANDLFEETDPVAVHGIISDLRMTGFPAFYYALDVQRTAHRRLTNDEVQYMVGTASGDKTKWAKAEKQLHDAAYSDFLRREGASFYGTDVAEVFNQIIEAEHGSVRLELTLNTAPLEERPDWRARYARDTATIYESSIILSSVITASDRPEQTNGIGAWLLDVDWAGRRVGPIRLQNAYVSGNIVGADFSNANLQHTRLAVQKDLAFPVQKGTALPVTAFCGTDLFHAEIGKTISAARSAKAFGMELDDFSAAAYSSPSGMIDFTASNWWQMDNLTPRARELLESYFPQKDQERLRALPREEQVRLCAERRSAGIRPTPVSAAASPKP